MATHGRDVTKISSCQVYAISRWGTEQPGSLGVGFIFLLFPMKVDGGLAHSSHGKFLALSDSPAWEVANRPLKVAVWLFLGEWG